MLLLWLLLGIADPARISAGNPLTPTQLAKRVQDHVDQMKDFEADFTQRYTRRIIGKVIEEKGVVAIKKPGRMRWDYLSPEDKLFISDGSKTYLYLREEKQVIVSHAPEGALGMSSESPFALLAGTSRLLDAFDVQPSRSEPRRGGQMLRLIPRSVEEDVREVELEVEPATGRIRRVLLTDGMGNQTEFRFDDIRENQDLPNSLFVFTIPSGVEIVLASESVSPPKNQELDRP